MVDRWGGPAHGTRVGGVTTLTSMGRFYAHTPLWNHTGAPAVTLPVDTGAELPRAVQLVAAPGPGRAADVAGGPGAVGDRRR